MEVKSGWVTGVNRNWIWLAMFIFFACFGLHVFWKQLVPKIQL